MCSSHSLCNNYMPLTEREHWKGDLTLELWIQCEIWIFSWHLLCEWVIVVQSCPTLFSSAQSLGRVQLFATPWTEACQASLSITNSQSLLKLMCIKLVMPSNHLILCCPLLLLPSIFPSIRGFSNESVLHIRWLGVSALASVLPMNIQNCCPLGLTGNSLLLTCISLSALSSHNASGAGDTIML